MKTEVSQLRLVIAERISNDRPLKWRRREVVIENDSLTIGSDDKADILLRSFFGPFQIEIKFHDHQWWLINLHRDPRVRIHQKPVELDSVLQHEDEISVHGHLLKVQQPSPRSRLSPVFAPAPSSDEALWQLLVSNKDFDEIMINGLKPVMVDFRGSLFESPWHFRSLDFLVNIVRKASDKSSGWASWQWERRLRFQAALPPLVQEPHLTIRKARETLFSLQELVTTGFATSEQMDFLKRALRERKNILISGGTSTGKTSLLRSLIAEVPHDERLIILEEEAEAVWPHPHAISIEAGRGHLASAIVESLRMRPDRLIVSEVRSREASDLIQAMNTGHEGSMTTLHANSPREALFRLESLALSDSQMSGAMTLSALRRQMSQALHLICHLARRPNGERFIAELVAISGMEGDLILLSEPIGQAHRALKQS